MVTGDKGVERQQ